MELSFEYQFENRKLIVEFEIYMAERDDGPQVERLDLLEWRTDLGLWVQVELDSLPDVVQLEIEAKVDRIADENAFDCYQDRMESEGDAAYDRMKDDLCERK